MPLLCPIAVSLGNVNQLGVVVVHLIYSLGLAILRKKKKQQESNCRLAA
jgi:hypothetical protein